MWLADENIDLASVFVGSAVLNYDIANNAEHVVRRFERRAEDHDGWDDVEVIVSGTKELPQPDMSFFDWIASFFVPEFQIADEAGSVITKVTYDDGTIEYYDVALVHVDQSEFTVEGWVLQGYSRVKRFDADDDSDKISEYEDKLIERYEADNEAEEEEEESEQTTDDSTGTDDSSSDADSSADDSSNGTDSSANDSSSDSDSSADDNNSTEDEEEEEKTEAELEAEKYPNEHLRNKENVTDDEFVSFVDKMEIDSIDIYEDDNGYYIIEKLDMAKRDTYAEANKDTLISTMKAEDFEGVVDALAEAVKVVDNKEALERYNATDVYERQTEASEDN